MQQRGFAKEHVDLILRFGKKRRVGDAKMHTLTKRIAQKLLFLGYPKPLVEKCKSSYVVSNGQTVITVAHLY
jgi:hypothetical protein